ncbi:MAG TPA: redox-sensing transcriptional repressor Rex [Candidatus Eisenbacteria bacterium]|nr:redox-sensing transcriptional repressor Rex [Candidatus Eisenbacteria bacterium]
MDPRIPTSTIRRLSGYYRVLEELEAEGERTISSQGLAHQSGVTSAQVRKDLSYFGNFGKRGLGYSVPRLRREIRLILGLNRRWKVALVGAGNIGSALYSYKEFRRQGFDIVGVYDVSVERVGQRWRDLTIGHLDELAGDAPRLGMEIGVIAVPARAAQAVADRLVAAGMRGILNFAHRRIQVPASVALRTVNLSIELESLAFTIKVLNAKPAAARARKGAAALRVKEVKGREAS